MLFMIFYLGGKLVFSTRPKKNKELATIFSTHDNTELLPCCHMTARQKCTLFLVELYIMQFDYSGYV